MDSGLGETLVATTLLSVLTYSIDDLLPIFSETIGYEKITSGCYPFLENGFALTP